MRSKICIFLVVATVLIACKNDDLTPKENPISGVWNLKNVSGGFAGVNIDYTKGEVIWNFKPESKELIIEKNIETTGPESIYADLESGTYSYEIITDSDTQTLYINNTKRGHIFIEKENLFIDDGIDADGFIAEYEQ